MYFKQDCARSTVSFGLHDSINLFVIQPHVPNLRPEDQFKRAIVRLISPEEAQRAVRGLHRRYLRNARVTVKVVE